MIRRLLCLGILLASLVVPSVAPVHAAGTRVGNAALPPGYFVDRKQLVADRPIDRVEAEGDFTLAIHRRYEGPGELKLLSIAEALYPAREVLIARSLDRNQVMGSDSAKVSLWWCDGSGVSRVPYAVTLGAIQHYTELTDRFRAHNFRGAWDHNLFWTDLRYDASISFRPHYYLEDSTVSNVYVAEMALSWSFDDGTFVPVAIAHRVVVMSREGDVLVVKGDGYTDEQVYMSSHRGIGRVEQQMR